jgi:peptide/nickel transport system permease protein
MTRIGALVVVVAVLAAIFGPMLAPFDPSAQELALRLEGPSSLHWFGLDELGRDIFARVLSGARISLMVGIVVVSVSATIGTVLGAIAGYFGGRVDEAISRIIDILLAFPGPAPGDRTGRRSGTELDQRRPGAVPDRVGRLCTTRSRAGIESSRVRVRTSRSRARRPDVAHPGSTHHPDRASGGNGSGDARYGRAILAEASLSFLGLGVQPPTPSWGTMLSYGRSHLLDAPHLTIFPGLP